MDATSTMSTGPTDAAVPVTVRASGSDPDVAPRALVVRVLTGTRMALGQREKLLHIEITDDSDLLFLYTLDVSEDEFPRVPYKAVLAGLANVSLAEVDLQLTSARGADAAEVTAVTINASVHVTSGESQRRVNSPPLLGRPSLYPAC